ncbi:MAG: aldo/keto reductase [Peptococcia bacterium]
MEYRILGKTGIKVSRLCFGALTVGPLQANLPIEEGAAVLRYALENGVNFIDTAKLYKTYPYIKKALKGWDKPVVIASKSYDYTWEGMKKSLEEARIAIDRDYIDIFMLHEQESELTLEGHREALEYLVEAKEQGLIRAIGVSTHTVEVVRAAIKRPIIEVIHPIVNLQGIGLQEGTKAEMEEALQLAYAAGKGIYGMKPLGGGNLIPQRDEALKFAFQHPYVHSVAVGCRMKEEIDYNLAILAGENPPEDSSRRLKMVKRQLHIEEWCEGCGACVERCPFNHLEIKDNKAQLQTEDCVLCGYCGSVCPNFAIKVI